MKKRERESKREREGEKRTRRETDERGVRRDREREQRKLKEDWWWWWWWLEIGLQLSWAAEWSPGAPFDSLSLAVVRACVHARERSGG